MSSGNIRQVAKPQESRGSVLKVTSHILKTLGLQGLNLCGGVGGDPE